MSFSEWIILRTGGQPMVQLLYTTYISVDLARHGLFLAKVGKGGRNNASRVFKKCIYQRKHRESTIVLFTLFTYRNVLIQVAH